MLDHLIRLVRGGPSHRPYEHLSDDAIVDRYAEARARLEGSWSNNRDAVVVSNHLMAEWERRHDELASLETRADRRNETSGDG